MFNIVHTYTPIIILGSLNLRARTTNILFTFDIADESGQQDGHGDSGCNVTPSRFFQFSHTLTHIYIYIIIL